MKHWLVATEGRTNTWTDRREGWNSNLDLNLCHFANFKAAKSLKTLNSVLKVLWLKIALEISFEGSLNKSYPSNSKILCWNISIRNSTICCCLVILPFNSIEIKKYNILTYHFQIDWWATKSNEFENKKKN